MFVDGRVDSEETAGLYWVPEHHLHGLRYLNDYEETATLLLLSMEVERLAVKPYPLDLGREKRSRFSTASHLPLPSSSDVP